MVSTAVFRGNVTERQATLIRERILKAGIEVNYQEEQRGAALVLIVKCKLEQAHSVRDIWASAGVLPDDEVK